MPVAIITGASRGLGLATARALVGQGWSVVADARRTEQLQAAAGGMDAAGLDAAANVAAAAGLDAAGGVAPAGGVAAGGVAAAGGLDPAANVAAAAAVAPGRFVAVPGDVTDPGHRAELVAAARRIGTIALLINNASRLGPSPQPGLAAYPQPDLAAVYAVNVLAPVALTQLVIADLLSAGGTIVNVSSDAAVEAYPGWGGYGSSKAALDQVSAILGVEHPSLRVYAFDPGDMRTELHQQAFPGEDISDRPEPDTVAPAVLRLLAERPPSARYRAADLLAAVSR